MELGNLGSNFRKYRKEAKLSQKQVSERLGICQSNISDWENNISRPDYEKLVELADMYEVSLYDLLGVPDKRF